MEHVKTQMPYALIAAGVAIFAGFLPAGHGLNPYAALTLGAVALALLAIFFRTKTP
jgi:Na+/H+ antiporter NhaC